MKLDELKRIVDAAVDYAASTRTELSDVEVNVITPNGTVKVIRGGTYMSAMLGNPALYIK